MLRTLLAGLAILAPVQNGGTLIDRVAAVVDGEVITLSEITSRLANRGQQLSESPAEREAQLRAALEEFIDRLLIARAAFETPFFEITEAEVDDYVARRRRIQGEERLAELLAASQLSEDEFRELAREELAVTRFVELRFGPFVIVLPDEIDRRYDDLYGRFGEFAPPLTDVSDDLEQALAQEKVQEQAGRWVRAERRKADVRVLLFRDAGKGNRPQ